MGELVKMNDYKKKARSRAYEIDLIRSNLMGRTNVITIDPQRESERKRLSQLNKSKRRELQRTLDSVWTNLIDGMSFEQYRKYISTGSLSYEERAIDIVKSNLGEKHKRLARKVLSLLKEMERMSSMDQTA